MSDFTQAVQSAYHCVLFMVEPDATREEAERAIDGAPRMAVGMSFAVRAAVLEKFEPAERDPIPFVDYLPEPAVAPHLSLLDGLNTYHSRDLAMDWAKEFPEVAAVVWPPLTDSPEVRLHDGTVIVWSPLSGHWEFAPVVAFVPEHGESVAR